MAAFETPRSDVETIQDDLVEVGVYASFAEGSEHGLVVLALHQPYWLEPRPDGFSLRVEPCAAPLVRRQLAAYASERLRWPPPPIADPWQPARIALVGPLLWAAMVLAIFHLGPQLPQWLARGWLDAGAVFEQGEIWRLATALFLHGDASHVISNTLAGILVFTAVLSTLGQARGWLLLGVAAIAGNLATAAINYPATYHSLGASTAIFAGVGLLTGRAVRVAARARHPHRGRALFAPVAAGCTVLALYGAGGVRTDVGAHLSGFLAGVVLGLAAALAKSRAA